MQVFAFAVGLTLRRGQQILEFRRHLSGDEIQFEDPLTGRIYSWAMSKILREIHSGSLAVVSGEDVRNVQLAESPKSAAPLIPSLESLPEKYRSEMDRRLDYVNAARKQGLTLGRRRMLAPIIKMVALRRNEKAPSTSTVMTWWRKLNEGGGNVGSLLTKNYRRVRKKALPSEISGHIRKVLKAHYFQRSRPSLTSTVELINRTLPVSVGGSNATVPKVSLSTVRRICHETEPYYRDVARFGSAYARNKWRYSLRGTTATRVLERVEVDHTQIDLIVVCDRSGLPLGRPTITVAVDAYSGYVISFFVSFWGPSLAATLNTLKIAINPKDSFCTGEFAPSNPWLGYGLFELLVVDNGLEFHSPQFKLAAWTLNTDIQYCAVRQPWLKPTVERTLGSLGNLLPSAGKVHKPMSNYLPPDPRKTAAISFSQLCRALLTCFVDVLPFQATTRTLVEPFELFREGFERRPPPLLPTSLQELDLISALSKHITIGNEGAKFEHLRYNSKELAALRNRTAEKFKTTVKYQPDDLSYAYVQDPVSKQWLQVPSCQPEYTEGLSLPQHRAIRVHLKDRLKERNAEAQLIQGKAELVDLFDGFLRGKRGKRNVKAAQRFGALTSAQILAGREAPSLHRPAEPALVVESEVTPELKTIPSFESFQLI